MVGYCVRFGGDRDPVNFNPYDVVLVVSCHTYVLGGEWIDDISFLVFRRAYVYIASPQRYRNSGLVSFRLPKCAVLLIVYTLSRKRINA